MDIKKAIGLCACRGCLKKATRLMMIKDSKGRIKEVQLCDNCAWKLYLGE